MKRREKMPKTDRYHEYMGLELEHLYMTREIIRISLYPDKADRLAFIDREIALLPSRSGSDND